MNGTHRRLVPVTLEPGRARERRANRAALAQRVHWHSGPASRDPGRYVAIRCHSGDCSGAPMADSRG